MGDFVLILHHGVELEKNRQMVQAIYPCEFRLDGCGFGLCDVVQR